MHAMSTLAIAGAFGLVLFAAPSYAQTAPAADAQASVISPLPAKLRAAADDTTIRPFRINVPEAQLVDLRRRVAATRWPDKETVTDRSQGVQLATMQKLAHYWATDYDWRKVEARLNALPQFMTNIDGVDIGRRTSAGNQRMMIDSLASSRTNWNTQAAIRGRKQWAWRESCCQTFFPMTLAALPPILTMAGP